ncbi:MAG: hypothetical protein GY834_03770, partial [Bacteroidetes bacterium]|nr:hypothetical protein [Bacteroidota bacterium]
GAPVFSHPTGNVEINYSDETMRESSGEKDIKRTFNGTSERSDCEVSPDKTQMIYLRSGVGIEDENKGLTRKLEDKKVFQQGDTLFYNVDFADQTKFNVSISNRLGQEEKIKHYNIRSGDIYVVLDQSVSMGNKTVQARYIDGNSIKKGEKILVKEK